MEHHYRSIEAPIEDLIIKEKGSKFIGYLFPVESTNEVNKALESVRLTHPKATHHCYAYRLGKDGSEYRVQDDGEPSGSAGLPIYNQLLAKEVVNTLLIVVRYYGGVKLGVSGLIKTYKETAKATLDEAKIIEITITEKLALHFPFEQQNTVFTLLNKHQAKILKFDANEVCEIHAEIKQEDKKGISQQLLEMPSITFEFIE